MKACSKTPKIIILHKWIKILFRNKRFIVANFFHTLVRWTLLAFITLLLTDTAWKVSKEGVTSGPYFPVVGLNTEIYPKIRTKNNSIFEHFSRSVSNCSNFSRAQAIASFLYFFMHNPKRLLMYITWTNLSIKMYNVS